MIMGGKKKKERSELIDDLWMVLTNHVHNLSNSDIIDLTFIIKRKGRCQKLESKGSVKVFLSINYHVADSKDY